MNYIVDELRTVVRKMRARRDLVNDELEITLDNNTRVILTVSKIKDIVMKRKKRRDAFKNRTDDDDDNFDYSEYGI